MRASWRRLAGSHDELRRCAYSLDAVIEEAAFVVGPVLAAAAVAWAGAQVVVVGAALVLLSAVTTMALVVDLRPVARSAGPVEPDRTATAKAKPLWRNKVFLHGLVPAASVGFLLGAVDIAAVAAAVHGVGERLAGLPAAALAAAVCSAAWRTVLAPGRAAPPGSCGRSPSPAADWPRWLPCF